MTITSEPYEFSCAAMAGGCRILGFRGSEELGQCFQYWVCCAVQEEDSLALDPARVLAAPATLTIGPAGDALEVDGYVAEVELLQESPQPIYRLLLTPELWFLRYSVHSRVFVDRAFPDVLREVLQRNRVAPQVRLTGTYPVREHLCQYSESDLAFLERWMEREGIYYFFDHTQPQSPLVICDAPSHHQELPDAPIPYRPGAGLDGSSGEAFYSFAASTQALTKAITVSNYNYSTPSVVPTQSMSIAAELPAETHLWAENEKDAGGVARVASVRAERELARRSTFCATGSPHQVHAGYTFCLEDHPMGALNQEYLVVRLARLGQSNQQSDAASLLSQHERVKLGANQHWVEVEAVPAGVQYRPPARHPWPEAAGLELALIDGPADSDYAQLDEEGRYLVRLLFDEAEAGPGQASTRVRQAQPHAGNPEGWHLPLRKGTEVLTSFVGGDPDRPVIAGALPNAITPSPVTAGNHTKNIVQTGGRSRLEIEDQEGHEYVDISTPPMNTHIHLGAHGGLGDHNIVLSTDGDGLIYTKGNRDITVGATQNETVKGNVTEHYQSDQTTHVAGVHSEAIDAGAVQTVQAGVHQTVTGGLNQEIQGGETRTVSGGVAETVNGSRWQTIHGDSTETIDGSLVQTVTGGVGVNVTGSYSITANGGIQIHSNGPVNLTADAGFVLNAAGGQTCIDETQARVCGFFDEVYALQLMGSVFNISPVGLNIGATLARHDKPTIKREGAGVVIKGCAFKKQSDGLSKSLSALREKHTPALIIL